MNGRLAWYWHRMRAMSARELAWRIRQRRLQKRETARFAVKRSIAEPLYPSAANVAPALGRLREAVPPSAFVPEPGESVKLPGGHDYTKYAADWHAGITTPARWPLVPSYSMTVGQRTDTGDVRVNWELNRHRQFVRLAAAGNIARLEQLLNDWTSANPFLWGVSWTSPMEIALRTVSWLTAARIIAPGGSREALRAAEKLLTGAANMTEYLTGHLSAFSSANNHLIVEAAAIAMSGLVFGRGAWTDMALSILDRELRRQVSADGVDLESSLHYHAFVLEAYLVVWQELAAAGRTVPAFWRERLAGMARFIAAARVADGCWCSFGDDDEACILDHGDKDYYDNLLGLYTSLSGNTPATEPEAARTTFAQGGYSFLRSEGMFVGIDHAPLGFGSIAAHAHNDILSFQLFLDGRPVLIDPGTYSYHADPAMRDLLRSTRMHNTVAVDSTEQSQMLGPFLWGRKARTTLDSTAPDGLTASVRGLAGVTHTRRWRISPGGLTVTDSFDKPCRWEITLVPAPGLKLRSTDGRHIAVGDLLDITTTSGTIATESAAVSAAYGTLQHTELLRIAGSGSCNTLTLRRLRGCLTTDVNARVPYFGVNFSVS